VERYEYDVYGACRIPHDQYRPRSSTQYANPYLFTGRRLDILDTNGSLKIQYNRNRYYDPQTGRWLTHDPLGITPNPPKPNKFDALGQYEDGMSLYEYGVSNPVRASDVFGLISCDQCLKRYDYSRKRITRALSECHASCGCSDVGLAAGVCAIACAKTGVYFPVCWAACTGVGSSGTALCHLGCEKQESRNIDNADFVLELCLSKCTTD